MRSERDYINRFSINRRENSNIKNAFKKAKKINYYDCIQMMHDKLISLNATYEPKVEEDRNLYLEKDINELKREIHLMEMKYNEEVERKIKQKKLDLFEDLDDKSFGRTLDLLEND